jgi:hypothetical protein
MLKNIGRALKEKKQKAEILKIFLFLFCAEYHRKVTSVVYSCSSKS